MDKLEELLQDGWLVTLYQTQEGYRLVSSNKCYDYQMIGTCHDSLREAINDLFDFITGEIEQETLVALHKIRRCKEVKK